MILASAMSAIPPPLQTAIFGGEFPKGDVAAMRRVEEGWRGMGTHVASNLVRLDLVISGVPRAIGGTTGDEITAGARKLRAALENLRDFCFGMAEQIETCAADTEKSQWEMVVFGLMTVYQVLLAGGSSGIGALPVVTAARETFVAMLERFVAKVACEGVAAVAGRTGLRAVYVAGFSALQAGIDAGIQYEQIAAGHRRELDGRSIGIAGLSGAGAMVGGMIGGRLAEPALPSRAPVLLGRATVTAAAGVSGVLGAAAAAAAITGQFDMHTESILSAIAIGIAGSRGHAPSRAETISRVAAVPDRQPPDPSGIRPPERTRSAKHVEALPESSRTENERRRLDEPSQREQPSRPELVPEAPPPAPQTQESPAQPVQTSPEVVSSTESSPDALVEQHAAARAEVAELLGVEPAELKLWGRGPLEGALQTFDKQSESSGWQWWQRLDPDVREQALSKVGPDLIAPELRRSGAAEYQRNLERLRDGDNPAPAAESTSEPRWAVLRQMAIDAGPSSPTARLIAAIDRYTATDTQLQQLGSGWHDGTSKHVIDTPPARTQNRAPTVSVDPPTLEKAAQAAPAMLGERARADGAIDRYQQINETRLRELAETEQDRRRQHEASLYQQVNEHTAQEQACIEREATPYWQLEANRTASRVEPVYPVKEFAAQPDSATIFAELAGARADLATQLGLSGTELARSTPAKLRDALNTMLDGSPDRVQSRFRRDVGSLVGELVRTGTVADYTSGRSSTADMRGAEILSMEWRQRLSELGEADSTPANADLMKALQRWADSHVAADALIALHSGAGPAHTASGANVPPPHPVSRPVLPDGTASYSLPDNTTRQRTGSPVEDKADRNFARTVTVIDRPALPLPEIALQRTEHEETLFRQIAEANREEKQSGRADGDTVLPPSGSSGPAAERVPTDEAPGQAGSDGLPPAAGQFQRMRKLVEADNEHLVANRRVDEIRAATYELTGLPDDSPDTNQHVADPPAGSAVDLLFDNHPTRPVPKMPADPPPVALADGTTPYHRPDMPPHNQCGPMTAKWQRDRTGRLGIVVEESSSLAGQPFSEFVAAVRDGDRAEGQPQRFAIDPDHPHRHMVDALLELVASLPPAERAGVSLIVVDGTHHVDQHGVSGHAYRLEYQCDTDARNARIECQDPARSQFGPYDDTTRAEDLSGIWAMASDRHGNPLQLSGAEPDNRLLEIRLGRSNPGENPAASSTSPEKPVPQKLSSIFAQFSHGATIQSVDLRSLADPAWPATAGTLGGLLRQIREEHSLLRAQIAERAGVSDVTISDAESGKCVSTVAHIEALADSAALSDAARAALLAFRDRADEVAAWVDRLIRMTPGDLTQRWQALRATPPGNPSEPAGLDRPLDTVWEKNPWFRQAQNAAGDPAAGTGGQSGDDRTLAENDLHVPAPSEIPRPTSAVSLPMPQSRRVRSPLPTGAIDRFDRKPGHVVDGIRYFETNLLAEWYGEQYLGGVFASLPPEQQMAVIEATKNSYDLQRILRSAGELSVSAIESSLAAAYGDVKEGWSLYELTHGRVPTLVDLIRMSGLPDLTPVQRRLIADIIAAPDPEHQLNRTIRVFAGLRGLYSAAHGGWPSAIDVMARIALIDLAVRHPLPEGLEVHRGLNDASFMLTGVSPYELIDTVWVEPGYSAASLGRNPWEPAGFTRTVHLHITVPKGTNALWIGRRSHYPNQREILFGRGFGCMITKVRWDGLRWHLHATAVVDALDKGATGNLER